MTLHHKRTIYWKIYGRKILRRQVLLLHESKNSRNEKSTSKKQTSLGLTWKARSVYLFRKLCINSTSPQLFHPHSLIIHHRTDEQVFIYKIIKSLCFHSQYLHIVNANEKQIKLKVHKKSFYGMKKASTAHKIFAVARVTTESTLRFNFRNDFLIACRFATLFQPAHHRNKVDNFS